MELILPQVLPATRLQPTTTALTGPRNSLVSEQGTLSRVGVVNEAVREALPVRVNGLSGGEGSALSAADESVATVSAQRREARTESVFTEAASTALSSLKPAAPFTDAPALAADDTIESQQSTAGQRHVDESQEAIVAQEQPAATALAATLIPEGAFAMSRVPVKGATGSGFGPRTHPITGQYKQHNGLDIAANLGTDILAPSGGVVSLVSYQEGGAGHWIELEHGDGTKTRYFHLAEAAPLKVGDSVSAGQTIGLVGSTGASTGPHLHFEVLQGGEHVDPLPFWQGATSAEDQADYQSFLGVKLQQRNLTNLGLYSGKIDGDPGEKTQRAYEAYLKVS